VHLRQVRAVEAQDESVAQVQQRRLDQAQSRHRDAVLALQAYQEGTRLRLKTGLYLRNRFWQSV